MLIVELVVDALLAKFAEHERTFARAQRIRALRDRDRWRKADIPRLRQLGIPSWAEPRMKDLESSQKLGRGVVKDVQTLEERVSAYFPALKILADPGTPPHIRRKLYKSTRWFPEFVEAAYRGELRRLHEQLSSTLHASRKPSHRRLYKMAEKNVADAACISIALVRKYCHEVRKGCGEACLGPATSATELKEHLEQGPTLLRESRESGGAPT